MSIFSLFALYPRSGYYSGAALEVRRNALLYTFFTLLCSAAVLRHSGRYIGHIFHFGTYAILHFTQ